jgi:hypothetical protein
MPEQSVSDVVAAWFGGDHILADALYYKPEIAWEAILEILVRNPSDEDLSLLAAGPLEDLIASHGAQFIDRVEQQALVNPKFADLLGGVWQQGMPAEIWSRVEKARGGKIW